MEVEMKFRIENPEDLEKRIRELGGIFVKEVVEEDLYFNHPCRDFSNTDEALRIRNGNIITYKGPRVDSRTKSREEINVKTEDSKKMGEILEKLGFKFVAKVVKNRRYYRIKNVTVTIDKVENLGKFAEVECIGDYEPCREEVFKVKNRLDLKNSVNETYLEMLLAQRGST